MAIFGPKPWINPFGKMSIFRVFELSCFHSVEKRFFALEYRKRYFPGLYCKKIKKLKKWPFFDQNHGLTPLQKCQFFDVLNFLFLYPRRGFFRSRISDKKPWVNPFGKMSIFRLFDLLVFIR